MLGEVPEVPTFNNYDSVVGFCRMPERWLGLVVGNEEIEVVDLLVPATGPLEVEMQDKWKLHAGPRPAAYEIMFTRISDYVKEHAIARVVIKGSAVSGRSTGMGHLTAAELRGVAAAAGAKHSKVEFSQKAHLSKTFGERDTDEYLSDSTFWANEITGKLAVGRREAAFLVLAKTRPRP